MKQARSLRAAECSLALIGGALALYGAWHLMEGWAFQQRASLSLSPQSSGNPAPQASPVAASLARLVAPAAVHVLGRLSIPRLHTSVLVVDGDDDLSLRLGVGHVPGTKMPGEVGNVGLAAHRDTYFRELRNVKAGDQVVLTAGEHTTVYTIATSSIVDPGEVAVLNESIQSKLTLITCYPFGFIGDAPKRFVVTALVRKAPAEVSPARAANEPHKRHAKI